ncbi:hypothetical protein, partial [Acinetobacter junii]|uniref:hypothetical protein n=1 Tax=Acinetobacter junii TaxID=40215 RepID=UPI0030F7AF93
GFLKTDRIIKCSHRDLPVLYDAAHHISFSLTVLDVRLFPFSSHKGQTFKNCQPFHISIMLNIYSNAKLNK